MDFVSITSREGAILALDRHFKLIVAKYRDMANHENYKHRLFAIEPVYLPGGLKDSPYYKEIVAHLNTTIPTTVTQHKLMDAFHVGYDIVESNFDFIWEDVKTVAEPESEPENLVLLTEKHNPGARQRVAIILPEGRRTIETVDFEVWQEIARRSIGNYQELIYIANERNLALLGSVEQMIDHQRKANEEGVHP